MSGGSEDGGGANVELDSAISDVTGLSGRAMIEALIAGQEGHRSRRCLHPDRRLSHAQGWRLLSGPRPRAL